eukprot:s3111_g1.t1
MSDVWDSQPNGGRFLEVLTPRAPAGPPSKGSPRRRRPFGRPQAQQGLVWGF